MQYSGMKDVLGYEIFDLDLISKNIIFDTNKTKMGQLWKNKLSTQISNI